VRDEIKPAALPNPADRQVVKVLSNANRHELYGHVLESIFEHPTFREVLCEIVSKELEKTGPDGINGLTFR